MYRWRHTSTMSRRATRTLTFAPFYPIRVCTMENIWFHTHWTVLVARISCVGISFNFSMRKYVASRILKRGAIVVTLVKFNRSSPFHRFKDRQTISKSNSIVQYLWIVIDKWQVTYLHLKNFFSILRHRFAHTHTLARLTHRRLSAINFLFGGREFHSGHAACRCILQSDVNRETACENCRIHCQCGSSIGLSHTRARTLPAICIIYFFFSGLLSCAGRKLAVDITEKYFR